MPDPISAAPQPGALPDKAARAASAPPDGPLWEAAKALESTFLAQLLESAGLGETPEAFGGGPGEDQFASFLRAEQARAMTEAGGIGLAQTLYQSLTETRK